MKFCDFTFFLVESVTIPTYHTIVHRDYILASDESIFENVELKVYLPRYGEGNCPKPIPRVHRRIDFPKKGGVYWTKIVRGFGLFSNKL